MKAASSTAPNGKSGGPDATMVAGQIIDVPYALWLATLAGALMATIAFTLLVYPHLLATMLRAL